MMQKIIEELKERGFVDTLQRGINVCCKLGGYDEKRNLYASKKTLEKYIDGLEEDDELADKFFDFAMDLATELIIRELDLKPEENYEVNKSEELIFELTKLVKIIAEDK